MTGEVSKLSFNDAIGGLIVLGPPCTPRLALHNRSLSSDKSKGVKQLIFAKQTIQGCRSAVHSVTHSERSCHRSGDDC